MTSRCGIASPARRILRLQRCANCGRFRYPPGACCPNCLSTEAGWELNLGAKAAFYPGRSFIANICRPIRRRPSASRCNWRKDRFSSAISMPLRPKIFARCRGRDDLWPASRWLRAAALPVGGRKEAMNRQLKSFPGTARRSRRGAAMGCRARASSLARCRPEETVPTRSRDRGGRNHRPAEFPGSYAFRAGGGMIMAYRNRLALLDERCGEPAADRDLRHRFRGRALQ